MLEQHLDINLVGGMRPADQRLWAAVLLSYPYDFANSDGETFQQSLLDFMESLETGDLQIITEMAGVDLTEFLIKCDEALTEREKRIWHKKNWLK
jgi:hypothetical protein